MSGNSFVSSSWWIRIESDSYNNSNVNHSIGFWNRKLRTSGLKMRCHTTVAELEDLIHFRHTSFSWEGEMPSFARTKAPIPEESEPFMFWSFWLSVSRQARQEFNENLKCCINKIFGISVCDSYFRCSVPTCTHKRTHIHTQQVSDNQRSFLLRQNPRISFCLQGQVIFLTDLPLLAEKSHFKLSEALQTSSLPLLSYQMS